MKFYSALTFIGVICLIFSSCSLPENRRSDSPGALFTAAAQTLEAQLTQDRLPNSTPTTSATPIPTSISPTAASVVPAITPQATTDQTKPCDAAKFVSDVTIPDGTKLGSGESFIKTWRFANIGTCTWTTAYSLIFDAGDQIGGPASLPLPANVTPGQEVDVSVSLQAPSVPGKYRGYWRLRNPSGEMLPITNGYKGRSFYVDIQVNSAAEAIKFAVTSVAFSVSHAGDCAAGTYTVTAKITTNAAGSVTYAWKRSDSITDPLGSGTLTFSAASTQTISYDWASGATGLSMTLYIDNPNHQNFGTALLNCP